MGLEIEYRDNRGRKHSSLDSMINAEMGKLVDEAARNLERAVRVQRCSIHGQNASIAIRKGQDGFSYTLSGCCDELVRKAEGAVEPFIS
jgi:hypothetical protein